MKLNPTNILKLNFFHTVSGFIYNIIKENDPEKANRYILDYENNISDIDIEFSKYLNDYVVPLSMEGKQHTIEYKPYLDMLNSFKDKYFREIYIIRVSDILKEPYEIHASFLKTTLSHAVSGFIIDMFERYKKDNATLSDYIKNYKKFKDDITLEFKAYANRIIMPPTPKDREPLIQYQKELDKFIKYANKYFWITYKNYIPILTIDTYSPKDFYAD